MKSRQRQRKGLHTLVVVLLSVLMTVLVLSRENPFVSLSTNRQDAELPNRYTQIAVEHSRVLNVQLQWDTDIRRAMWSRMQGTSVTSGDSEFISMDVEKISRNCERRSLPHAEHADIDYVVIDPPNGSRAVLLLLHGCSHGARDFCPVTNRCQKCQGLPEEMRMVSEGLSRGMRVVAVSSLNRQSRCWDLRSTFVRRDDAWVRGSRDVERIALVLKHEGVLVQDATISNPPLPIVAMGASSGGTMVGRLAEGALGDQLIGIIAQVAAPSFMPGSIADHVAIVYATMERDKATSGRSLTLARILATQRGVGELSVRTFESGRDAQSAASAVMWVELKSQPIDADTFHQRLPWISSSQSKQIFDQLQSSSHLTTQSMLRRDPRNHGEWRIPLRSIAAQISDSLQADASPLAEEMNVLYAFHEFFSDHMRSALNFIERAAAICQGSRCL